MLKSIPKLIITALTALLINTTLYSQVAELNNSKDTTICFTLPQSKWLLKQAYMTKEFTSLDSICEKQIIFQDSIIKDDKEVISDQKIIITNDKEIMDLKDIQLAREKEKSKGYQREIRKQKVYKWVILASAAIIFSYETFLLIKK